MILAGCTGTISTTDTTEFTSNLPADGADTLEDLLAGFQQDLKGSKSQAYVVPEEVTLTDLRTALDDLFAGSREQTAFGRAGYNLTVLGEGSGAYLVVRQSAARGDALMVFNPEPAANLVVEAPHIGFETDIATQAAVVFDTLGARALVVNGAHRCANDDPSGCEGTTDVCGDPDWYRISDAAHATDSTFHVMHEALSDEFIDHTIVSLHGMGWDGGAVAIVSDGTTEVDEDSLGARFADALDEQLPLGFFATSCNKPSDFGLPDLCGTTNVQGRYTNGSTNACATQSPQSGNRFLHVEQALPLRRDEGEVHRGQVIEALRAVLAE